ncbi:hypothetical protein QBC44DRAFT_318257 [Cladorrhinum sp. PSN332]|nr:hypothetical protein QBC44DRAFT_318257 [Cladorrhinum sp. PSN332]
MSRGWARSCSQIASIAACYQPTLSLPLFSGDMELGAPFQVREEYKYAKVQFEPLSCHVRMFRYRAGKIDVTCRFIRPPSLTAVVPDRQSIGCDAFRPRRDSSFLDAEGANFRRIILGPYRPFNAVGEVVDQLSVSSFQSSQCGSQAVRP